MKSAKSQKRLDCIHPNAVLFTSQNKEEKKVNKSTDDLYMKGMEAMSEENYPKAIECFRAVIAVEPDFALAYCSLAKVHLKGDLPEFAECLLLLAADKDRKFYCPHSLLGEYYFNNNRMEDAIAHYEKAINIEPVHYASYHGLADIYTKMGMEEKAQEYHSLLNVVFKIKMIEDEMKETGYKYN